MGIINWILLAGSAFLLGVAFYTLLFGGKNFGSKPDKEKAAPEIEVEGDVRLEKLAEKLWLRAQETGEIQVEELSSLWVEEEKTEAGQEKEYFFNNEKIQEFFTKYIGKAPWFREAPLQKEVCYQILLILEREGDCSSVVNVVGDKESTWDSNTYSLLGKTTLLEHTIHVAEKVVALLKEEDAAYAVPNTMIAALGHDIGKIPSCREDLYSMGEHPLTAGTVLAGIEEFDQLKRKDEILRAIKLHHKEPEGLLGETLKKADQKARQKELEWATREIARKRKQQEAEENIPQEPESTTKPPAPVPSNPEAAWQAQADIYGDGAESKERTKKSGKPQHINISPWFKPDEFLEAMKPHINKIKGRYFKAFSMPDGYVYFQAKVLEEVARKQAQEANAVDIMSADDSVMQRVLLTIVDHYRSQQDIIAGELIQGNYFGGYFKIITSGKNMVGFYVPFHAEVFGSIAEMEALKEGTILKNFKTVTIEGKE